MSTCAFGLFFLYLLFCRIWSALSSLSFLFTSRSSPYKVFKILCVHPQCVLVSQPSLFSNGVWHPIEWLIIMNMIWLCIGGCMNCKFWIWGSNSCIKVLIGLFYAWLGYSFFPSLPRLGSRKCYIWKYNGMHTFFYQDLLGWKKYFVYILLTFGLKFTDSVWIRFKTILF